MKRTSAILCVCMCVAGVMSVGAAGVRAADDPGMPGAPAAQATTQTEAALYKQWLTAWETSMLRSVSSRYCDKETGEEIGWLISPYLNGFYYGYMATGDTKWVDLLVDWADAWIQRGVVEPDGYVGWPKAAGASTRAVPDFTTDNMLGEAMGLRPVVLMAAEILKTPALKTKYGQKAETYLALSKRTFEK